MYLFPVETENLGRTVDYRGEAVQYPGISKRFDDDFVTGTVAAALCDPGGEFIFDYGNMSFFLFSQMYETVLIFQC